MVYNSIIKLGHLETGVYFLYKERRINMDFAGVASVVGITVICYLAGMIARATTVDNKWIPVIVGIAGAILGVAGMYVIKDFPATDVINALAVGIVSGLASTGADQLTKISKK